MRRLNAMFAFEDYCFKRRKMVRKWKKRFRKQALVEFKCCMTVYGLRLKQITGSSLMILAQEHHD